MLFIRRCLEPKDEEQRKNNGFNQWMNNDILIKMAIKDKGKMQLV